jgi:hypothetical protein
MPQPTPNDGETHDEFIDRCMSNPTMVEDFDDNDQRLAVCNTIWDDSRSKPPTESEAKATTKPERRAIGREMANIRTIHRDDDAPPHAIEGYAAVFYNGTPETEFQLFDDMVERIMPGAFDDVLADKPDVRGLFNHDPDHLLGRTSAGTMSLSVDGKGLAYSIALADTTVARDVAEHVQRGDIDGSSFAFRVRSERFRTEDGIDIREIEKVEPLYDCGPVTYPAYAGTEAGFRATEDIAREVRAAVGKAGKGESPPVKKPDESGKPWQQGWRPRSSENKTTRALHEWAEKL